MYVQGFYINHARVIIAFDLLGKLVQIDFKCQISSIILPLLVNGSFK